MVIIMRVPVGVHRQALRARSEWDWVKSTRRLAGLQNPLGITRQQLREGDRRRWCYLLPAEQPSNRPRNRNLPRVRGHGAYRLRLGRFQFRYDIAGRDVELVFCDLRREDTHRDR